MFVVMIEVQWAAAFACTMCCTTEKDSGQVALMSRAHACK